MVSSTAFSSSSSRKTIENDSLTTPFLTPSTQACGRGRSAYTLKKSLENSTVADSQDDDDNQKFQPRPSFVPFRTVFGIFVTLTAAFSCVCLYQKFYGFKGEGKCKSLALTAHGGKGKFNDVQIFPLHKMYHGGYEMYEDEAPQPLKASNHGYRLFGKKLANAVDTRELRGMSLFMHKTDTTPSLIALNAYKKDSKIIEYKNVCSRHRGDLEVWRELHDHRCVHPYAITVLHDHAYLSCQTSNNVVRYHLNNPKMHGEEVMKVDSPRALAVSEGRKWLYVAERFQQRVVVYSLSSNQIVGSFHVNKPVGVVLSDDESKVYVGNRKTGHIEVFDALTFKHIDHLSHTEIEHPAGMAIDDGYLYVVCQKNHHVIAFDLNTGKFHFVVKHLKRRGEGLAILPCIPS